MGFWVMDQSVELNAGNRRLAAERLRDFIVTSVDAATASWERAQYPVIALNALRALVVATPDYQTC